MNLNLISRIRAVADGFIKHLKLKSKPQIFFVEKPGVDEVKVNDFFPEDKTSIYFNTSFLQNLNAEFAIIIVLHEIYHFSIQGIRTVKDVSEMRYGYLWSFMQLYDIEADVKVVEYLYTEGEVSSFSKYLSIVYQGSSVFRNQTVRLPKLERFIGSMITIKLFFDQKYRMLFLPKLYLNWLMLISVSFSEGLMRFSGFEFSSETLNDWTAVYQDASQLKEEEYIEMISTLADELLKKIDNEQ